MRTSTRITLHGGPEKMQKRGRAKQVLSRFWRVIKESLLFLENSTFKSELFREIFYLYVCPCLFTVHVRPVLSPCQAGNTHVIKYSNMCKINTSYTFVMHIYMIVLAPLFILGITGFCSTIECNHTQ